MDVRRIEESTRTRSSRQIPPADSGDVLDQRPAPAVPATTPGQPRDRGGGIGWIIATLLVTVVLGGVVYGAMRFDLLQPGQPAVSIPVVLPTTTTPTPAELPATETPPNPETQTPVVPTPTVTRAPTPIPTSTPIATPTMTIVVAIPTEQAIVVNAFAECDRQYSGADRQFRARAANLAIEEGRQTVADIRRLVDEYCNGSMPALADVTHLSRDIDTNTERPTLIKPAATAVPTPTPPPTKVPTLRPEPTPTPTTGGDGRFDQLEMAAALHHLVNAYRREQGRSELELDLRLMLVAQMHSEDMAKYDYYAHTNRAGDDPTARARKAGYNCQNPRSIGVAENIHVLYGHISMLYGQPYQWETQERMIQRFVADWINSPGHRRNILDPRYTKTGIGVGFGPYDGIPSAIFVTQKFC